MKSTNPFRNKTFCVYHKRKLFRKLIEEPIKRRDKVLKEFLNFFQETIYPKLLSPTEKYLLGRPFIRITYQFSISCSKLGLSVGRDEYQFCLPNHGLPIKEELRGRKLNLSDRIEDMCSDYDKDALKDFMVNIYLAEKEVNDFGKETGIAPLRYGPPFNSIKTIGQLERFNKEYYELLLELFPDDFKIDEKLLPIEESVINVRQFLGY